MSSPQRARDPFPVAMAHLMAERSLTVRAVERATGVDNAFISRMMRGKKAISVAALGRISEGLGLPPDYFVEVRLRRIQDWLAQDADLLDATYDSLRRRAGTDDH
jgi:transcriptional regulator with XRE-family HTH domain